MKQLSKLVVTVVVIMAAAGLVVAVPEPVQAQVFCKCPSSDCRQYSTATCPPGCSSCPGVSKPASPSSPSTETPTPAPAPAKKLGTKGLAQHIPDCSTPTLSAECRDVSIFVTFLIGFGRYLFTVIGAVALLFFVYGGFVLITSQGNGEKVKKGFGVLLSAVIGLAIAFSAYALVKYTSDNILPVKDEFKLN